MAVCQTFASAACQPFWLVLHLALRARLTASYVNQRQGVARNDIYHPAVRQPVGLLNEAL